MDVLAGGRKRRWSHGVVRCGPVPNATEPPSKPQLCCPKAGIWSAWSEWSHCVGECDKCGSSTRTRRCLSSGMNCPCQGVESEKRTCRVVGIWGAWSEPSPCSDICGTCAQSTRKRVCSKANNCQCTGPQSLTEYCGIGTCRHPRQACCEPFNVTSIGGIIGCGPLPPMRTFPPVEDCEATPKPECCKVGGVWSQWSTSESCPDTCGSCAQVIRKRMCLSQVENNCPCSGPSTKLEYCGLDVCKYPRRSCCEPFKPAVMNGRIRCGPQPEPFEPKPSDLCMPPCCPKFGIWSEWSPASTCPDTCGSCAQTVRQRYCLSDGNGCPCVGEEIKHENCALQVCPYPRPSCCAPFRATVIDGRIVCGPQPKHIEVAPTLECPQTQDCCPQYGEWSEWTVTKPCMDVCGSCSMETKSRKCLSESDGCPCSGPSTISEYCNIGVCKYPRRSCCAPFKTNVHGGRIVCGPQPSSPPELAYVNKCAKTCCPANGIWSEWTDPPNCAEACGSCAKGIRTRKCLSENFGCPCTGANQYEGYCKTQVCAYPKRSCCEGFKATVVNGMIACGPQSAYPEPPPEKTTCCPPGGKGLWNDWQEWSPCSATACGGCQKRTRRRTCASAPFGCPCVGSATETGYCDQQVCSSGNGCCAPFSKTVNVNNDPICLQGGTMPPCNPEGLWSEWSSTACSDTCGLCGVMQRTRTCVSEADGCPCKGPSAEGTESCASELCLHPRRPCCENAKMGVENRRIVCVKA
ncbi:hypothetical protein QR680_017663 [Steinernema hermaphroditum]|uniref:Uncharacterized protein n=1 Tax=Steinernema hermaphroditum TaxID=289476 RepID=A0AA39HHF2_9BILA|nr:hypothetical protein QR680_017663 [Steinernema hermaphroditum]